MAMPIKELREALLEQARVWLNGDLDCAEDLVHDALLQVLQHRPSPPCPEAHALWVLRGLCARQRRFWRGWCDELAA